MSKMSNLHVIQNDLPPSHLPDDVDWDAPGSGVYRYGDDAALLLRIRKDAANPAVPCEVRATLYLAAARIEYLMGQVEAKGG